jgi:hypothetical protein
MSELRPSIINEVRAWLLAGLAILAHTIAVVWWAATLNAKVDALRELVLRDTIQIRQSVDDHEQRLRSLEQHNRKLVN